ncbi:DNA polymerase III subunit delta [candidate division WOR-1 bacterium RIFCSPHIGHO2_01_FULL_53_15]|uniref:DNA-directed DNA polymerase n=1 Tax=candidate division WOR-1 bacterium RIFCSPHIGHO2_01_FULL_53_15 TaxID=1802564 RepID=A0A1F4Q006_UNCSA|nr:MAG: DNA polymerase III subunit delta [candidate division WOR-1 bacterium RIFCSPHIGHO2_01_FULL_53_15]OGC10666.1 MAG: DNA polymerase III subunit delta [candidate division WOR-1 bacterium RIFCSPHIGHO2_02_FULL_53_26]
MSRSKNPVFLFFGEEDFLIDEKIKEFKSRFSAPEFLDGEKLSLTTLSDSLCGGSLFTADKLVVIKEAKIDDQAAMIGLLQKLSDGTTVVFASSSADKRTKLYKWIVEHGEAVEFKTFAPWEQDKLLNWIGDRARGKGKKISQAAARLLQEICGGNLRLLDGEIEKIITYIGERAEIGSADVLALASAGETSAFALMDALREKDIRRSLTLGQALLRNKEDIFSLLGLMTSQYRLMLQIKSLAGRESEPNAIARLVGGSPYYVRKCSAHIGRFTLPELKKHLAALLAAGLKFKTGENQSVNFELLLADLCPAGR